MSKVGENVKAERERQKYSQNALAKKAGIAQATLNAIESSTKNPSVDTVILLARALGVSVAYLLGEEQQKEKEAESDLLRKSILDDYDRMTPAQRAKAREYMDLLLNQKP